MRYLWQYLAVAVAGAAGAVLRVAVVQLFSFVTETRFPLAILFINVGGSLFLGWFYSMANERMTLSTTTRIAVGAGFVGAYTTFSTLMYDSAALAQDRRWNLSLLNLALSLVLGLAAVRAGIWLGRLKTG